MLGEVGQCRELDSSDVFAAANVGVSSSQQHPTHELLPGRGGWRISCCRSALPYVWQLLCTCYELEALPVVVDIEADPPPAVRIQILAESTAGEREKIIASRAPKIRHGHLETSFAGLTPGAYEVGCLGWPSAHPSPR